MQKDIDAVPPGVPISILGVNYIGSEAGNPSVITGRDIPWLQDVPEQDVWQSWGVADKDVVILDSDNEVVSTYNVAQNDLSVVDNYEELRDLLLDIAAAQ